MLTVTDYLLVFVLTFLVVIFATPLIKKLALKLGAVDVPSRRKIHRKVMPRLGGLAIVLGVVVGVAFTMPTSPYMTNVLIGGLIITVVGVIDDIFQIKASHKLLGQLTAAIVVVASGLRIDMINLPLSGFIEFGLWSYPFTIIWIIGITNAMNLIDGLDGLAAGVSSIALTSILVMAVIDGQWVVVYLSIVLIASTTGFLVYNFHPAKIFMGDTGSLFLGYSISVLSMMGLFKNIAIFSFVMPVVILAVPIFDTVFAIIRRILRKKGLFSPDKSHLHYCLLELGFSHRKSVLIIYGISGFFGFSAIIFSATTMWTGISVVVFVMIVIRLIALRLVNKKQHQKAIQYLLLRLIGQKNA